MALLAGVLIPFLSLGYSLLYICPIYVLYMSYLCPIYIERESWKLDGNSRFQPWLWLNNVALSRTRKVMQGSKWLILRSTINSPFRGIHPNLLGQRYWARTGTDTPKLNGTVTPLSSRSIFGTKPILGIENLDPYPLVLSLIHIFVSYPFDTSSILRDSSRSHHHKPLPS